MLKRHYSLPLLFVGVMTSAFAAGQRDQYDYAAREAQARFAEDRAICSEERNHGQRKKCLRMAQSQRDEAMVQARAQNAPREQRRASTCPDCARVTNVSVSENGGGTNGLGAVAGGAAGALLGSQVGKGSGKTAATIAGAVGGAYVGNRMQQNSNKRRVWNVDVEYDNGGRRSFSFDHDPRLSRGDRVRNAGDSINRI